MLWKKLTGLGIFVLLLSAGYGYYRWQNENVDARRWVTAKVIRGDIEETTTALGMLQPLNYVDVGTQVSGQLRKIHVSLGSTVEEGDMLAEIDATLYAARVEAAQAQLRGLQAQLAEKQAQHDLARIQYERQQKMLDANATSQDAYQNAQFQLKITQAQMVQLTAQMRQVQSTLRADEANLGYTRILAPMRGTIVALSARQGQTLNANQQAPILLRIADLNTMTVWTQVSEADIGRLKLGMEAYFTTLGRPEHRHYGSLRQILPTPEVINNVILYNALFDVDNPDGSLGIQMSAQVSFVHAAAKDVVFVPIAALGGADKEKRGGKRDQVKDGQASRRHDKIKNNDATVRVVRDDRLETRSVVVGIKNRLQVQIISGLETGEEVVIANPVVSKPSAGSMMGGSSFLGGGHSPGGGRSRP
ncbi:MAG TPA: efflux RND transporter periplasmic adaptor subunit [Magnetococcales bacterium]|nr:efflux RND transporter periplasmic adaptor subunit [Magnetococcales bacterium]